MSNRPDSAPPSRVGRWDGVYGNISAGRWVVVELGTDFPAGKLKSVRATLLEGFRRRGLDVETYTDVDGNLVIGPRGGDAG